MKGTGTGTGTTTATGQRAEQAAEAWLSARGLTPVTRNFRCRRGELDLVMRDSTHLVVVEVRYRRNAAFGLPQETVSAVKRRRIISATRQLLASHPALANVDVRFDVVAVTGCLESPAISWIRDAFYA